MLALMIKFAISPIPPVDVVNKPKIFFTNSTRTPAMGLKANAMINAGKSEKSILRNVGNIGIDISKDARMKEMAASIDTLTSTLKEILGRFLPIGC